MYETLIIGGTVRRLWLGETELYRQHLLRLDDESRRNRFGGAVSDEFVRRYSEPSALRGVIIYGFFVDGVLRGAAELRLLARAGDAEAALSVERAWQSRGVGTALLDPCCSRPVTGKSTGCICFASPKIGACSSSRGSSMPSSAFKWIPAATALVAFVAWRAIESGREALPFLATIALFLLGYLGLLISNFPYIVPPSLTIWQAAAAPATHVFMLMGTLVMLPIIFGYTIFVYWIFSGKLREGEGYH